VTTPTDWPTPQDDKDHIPLQQVVLQARVDEIAAARASATPLEPPDLPGYPPTDAVRGDLAKAAYDVLLKRATSAEDAAAAQDALMAQTDVALVREFHESVRDVAKTALEHADGLPQLVITASGAVVTLYTGVLALAFAAASRPLPARGLIPGIFLGLAVALAVGYAGYITRARPTNFAPAGHVWPNATAHTNGFIDWINSAISARASLMRAAVLFLGLGVAFLPSAFIDFTAVGQSAPLEQSALVPPWPTAPSTDPGAAAELQKILYQAQIAEAATQRTVAATQAQTPTTVRGPGGAPAIEEVLWLAAILAGGTAVAFARREG
jgi:hypothetical protein